MTGVLFGGHVLNVDRERLLAWLYLAILTGAALVLVKTYAHARWLYQGRGVVTLLKLLLLCLVPWLWSYRVALLAAVIVLGSVGCHMPRHFRYYSFVDGRVVLEEAPPLPARDRGEPKS